MQHISAVELLIGTGATLIGFIVRRLYVRIDTMDDKIEILQRDDRLMEHKIAAHREHVATGYVSKTDHADFRAETHSSLMRIEDKQDKIIDKLDGKADK